MRWRIDRGLVLAMGVAAAVVVPRSFLVSRAHSENIDADYHLTRGTLFWRRALADFDLNDPPVGEALSAVPLALSGDLVGRFPARRSTASATRRRRS